MADYLITYDLRNQRNYDAVYEKIETWKAVRLLESVWLASVNDTAERVRNALMRIADFDDGLAVIEIAPHSDWATVAVETAGVNWLKRKFAA